MRVRGPLPIPLDEFPTRDTDARAEEGLRTNMYQLAHKQNLIIQELKGQCTVATDKIECLVQQFAKEKEQYEYSLAVLAKQNSAADRCPKCNAHLPPQAAAANSKVYETLCQKLEDLHNEKMEAQQTIRNLRQENFTLNRSPSKAITIVKGVNVNHKPSRR